MKRQRAYLDWNATAPILPESADAMARAQFLGNPSSIHAEGRAARAAIETARAEVAALVGVNPAQVTLTSGGTEAAATVLRPRNDDDWLFFGATEHACIRTGGDYSPERRRITGVSSHGGFDLDEIIDQVEQLGLAPNCVTVALQIANNETGTIQAVETFAALRARGWMVVADAVQAAGRMALEPYLPHVDWLFLSAHKIGGPKGVGALIGRADSCAAPHPLIAGGGQEKGMRGGTENVAGIVGFGVAAMHARKRLAAMGDVDRLRDQFEQGLRAIAPDAVMFAAETARLPNTSLFAIPQLRAETALIAFDLDGIAVSSGSACSSGKVGKSHVLAAMGVPDDLAACAIRVSLGDRTSAAEINQCLASLERQVSRLRARATAA